MDFKDLIKEKTDVMVESYKAKFSAIGQPMTERDELFFRNGIANGISIAGLALVSTDISDITNLDK